MQIGAYSPYGRGNHTCLGKSLAEVLLAMTMAEVFYNFDLEFESPNYELKTKTAPTPGPAMSFKVKVKRSEEHTSELQSLMRISYAVFCLKKNISSQIHIYMNNNNKE